MGQSGAPVGTAFVDILPKTDGFVASLTGQLKSAISQAAGGVDASPITKGLNTGLIALGGAAIAGIYKGIKATQDWVTEVQTLQRVTGQSAEGASALAATADEMGVSVSTMSSAMSTLSRNVSSNSTSIQKYGIVTKDATGATLPMDQILGEVQAKFQSLPEGVDRTSLATSLFGRAGRQLIPILGLSSDQMAEMADKAKSLGLVLSQDDVDAAQKLKIAQAELGDAFKGLQIQLGKVFIPILTALTKTMTAVVEVFARVPVPIKVAAVAFLGLNTAVVALRAGWGLLAKNFDSISNGLKTARDAIVAQTVSTDENTTSTLANAAANEGSNATQISTAESYGQAANALDTQTAATDLNTAATEANVATTGLMAGAFGDMVIAESTAVGFTATLTATLTGLWDVLNGIKINLLGFFVPLGWALLIIAAVIAVTVVVTKNWDTIKKVTADVWGGLAKIIVPAFNAIKAGVAALIQAIGPALAAVGNAFKAVWESLVGAFTAVVNAIASIAATLAPIFVGIWHAIAPILKLIAEALGAAIIGAIIGALYALAIVLRVVAAVITVAGKIIAAVWTVIGKIILTEVNIAIHVINFFIRAISVLVGVWKLVGPSIIAAVTSVASVIVSVWGGIVSVIKTVVSAIAGVIGGLVKVFGTVVSAIAKVFGGLWKAISPVILTIGKVIGVILIGIFLGPILAVVKLIQLLAKAWGIVAHAVAPVVKVFGLVAAALLKIDFAIFIAALKIALAVLAGIAQFIIGSVVGSFKVFVAVLGIVARFLLATFGPPIIAAFHAFMAVLGEIGHLFLEAFGPTIAAAIGVMEAVLSGLFKAVTFAWNVVKTVVVGAIDLVIKGINLLISAWNALPGHDDIALIPTLDTLNAKTVDVTASTQAATAATNDYAAASTKASAADQRRMLSSDELALKLDAIQGATDPIAAGFSKISGDMRAFSNSSGVDLSTYRDNLQKYVADPSSATLHDLRANLSGMKHDYKSWVDGIATSLADYGSVLDKFQNKNNVDLGKATQSLTSYGNQLHTLGTDIETLRKRYGSAATPFIQLLQTTGTAYLGLANSAVAANKKSGTAFFNGFKYVKTQAQITADAMAKALGTAFDQVLQDFRVMFNAVVRALNGVPPFKIDTSPAKAAIANLAESIKNLPTSEVFNIKGNYIPPTNGPSGSGGGGGGGNGGNALGGVIAGATGFIAHSPTLLVGEGHSPTPIGPGAEAVIPLNQRGKRIMQEAFGDLASGKSTVFAPTATDLTGTVRIENWRRGILSLDAEVAWEDAVRSS